MMLVQGPAAKVGRVQLKSLKQGCPFLPQDETRAGLIFKPDRHCKTKGLGQRQRKEVTEYSELLRKSEDHVGK